jgi:uncharacterized protein
MRFITIFLKVLFDNWERDLIQGKYISIRLFDNLVRMIGGYPPQACEMNGMCSIQKNSLRLPLSFQMNVKIVNGSLYVEMVAKDIGMMVKSTTFVMSTKSFLNIRMRD